MDISEVKETIDGKIQVLMEENGGDKKAVTTALVKMYESTVAEYRPLLEILSEVAKQPGNDLGTIIATVLNIFNAASKSPALITAQAEYQKNAADSRMKALKAYTKAGFTRAEALSLVLKQMTDFENAVKSTTQSISRSSKKE
ncbi:MAG: hypothetical protein NTY66_00625 [Candidatus Vogelbacteria bacterium]|nr:hypothetical protein [Candidatus Vogelbacteria bacterium]